MKTILALALTLSAAPALSATNLELAGDCKPKVEKVISSLTRSQAFIVAAEEVGDHTLIVTFNSLPQNTTLSRAKVTLDGVRTLARGRMVYAIDCSVLSLNFVR
ncbi:MAG: hypothetical protein KF789_12735 [Bdellovibrionaceae bacterium]|nr:hypothetical protein [Pseudobdellovibrionaceae bacterium]